MRGSGINSANAATLRRVRDLDLPRKVSLFGLFRNDGRGSSFRSDSKRGLDLRLEHVPDHRGQVAVKPLEEHLTRQLIRP